MNIFSKFLLLFLASGVITAGAYDVGYDEKEGPFVRVSNNDDGSRSIFKRNPGQMQMSKSTFDPGGNLVSVTKYFTGNYGEMRGCQIFDGRGNLLFKVRYAYNRSAQLKMELMYEAKSNALVSTFEYSYDAAGVRQNSPICKVYKQGRDAKERFRYTTPSALEKDPFAEEPKTQSRGKSLR